MPNGRPIDPVPLLGAAIIGGAVAWFIFRKKPIPRPKFSIGQRVALVANQSETGTITDLRFGIGGVQAWSYLVVFDSIGGTGSLLEERFLIAI